MNEPTIEVISPFPVEELPRVWLWMQESPSLLDASTAPKTMDEFVDGWIDRGRVDFGVYRDGELGGWIVYEPINRTMGNGHCVFKKGTTRADSFYGHKVTVPALTAAITDLFSIGIERINMTVFESNRAIQGLIKAIGGELEALWLTPKTEAGEPILFHGRAEPMLQYTIYAATFGKPNPASMTYGDWIAALIARQQEVKQQRKQASA